MPAVSAAFATGRPLALVGRPSARTVDPAAYCVDLLLKTLVEAEAEAVVMRSGEVPFMVAGSANRPLARRALTTGAVDRIITALLPSDNRAALADVGSATYQLPHQAGWPLEDFTVEASQSGADSLVEIRRVRVPEDDSVPLSLFSPADR